MVVQPVAYGIEVNSYEHELDVQTQESLNTSDLESGYLPSSDDLDFGDLVTDFDFVFLVSRDG